MAESEILLRLVGIVSGEGAAADPAALDDAVVAGLVQKAVQRTGSNVEGRDPDELLTALASRHGPERILDLMLRSGPYGDGFGAEPSGLSLEVLEEAPHGVDLGPLQPRIPEVLRTASGKIELAPEPIVGDVARLRSSLAGRGYGEMALVGRRDLRSNHSSMGILAPTPIRGGTMSTRGRAADTDERQMWVEGKRDRLELAREAGWGGVSWRSVVAGVFVAYGVIGACIGIAAAVLHPIGLTLDSLSHNDWQQVGLVAGLVAAAVVLGAFTVRRVPPRSHGPPGR